LNYIKLNSQQNENQKNHQKRFARAASFTKTNGDKQVGGRSSLRHTVAALCVRYFRGLIETCSSYVIMPCTFVFVLNFRPSSFDHADSSQRAMTVALPVVMLLLQALVIRRRELRQPTRGSFTSAVRAAA
jgi:hypothetical protein